MTAPELPVDAVLPRIVDELRDATALTIASPPGSGKTTRVPPVLLDLCAGQVLVLEPRRIAARAAARRVASELGSQVGDLVGYEVRDDRKVRKHTRLRFLTEGVLVRRVIADPYLEGVDVVVLDEFHERHVETDLAIAMLREIRETVRPDLRIVVMSATLDVEPVRAFLEPCGHVDAEGRVHEVRIEYVDRSSGDETLDRVRPAVARALDETRGDVLVFLPGMAEIRRAERDLAELARNRQLEVLPLHGSLDAAAQDRALQPAERRKVVLATNVAESSLTIEGVTAVVDTGLVRQLRHDTARGLDVLRVERVSLASAAQRAGRAGRTGPGVCYRLWSRVDERGFPEFEPAEIRRIDLSGPSLMVREFAGRDPREFGWFETPDTAALERADDLLAQLGLVEKGRITADGREAMRLPVHPRLGRMLCEAVRRDCAAAAAEIAALIQEREPWRGRGADLATWWEAFAAAERGGFRRHECQALGIDVGAARSAARTRERLRKILRAGPGTEDAMAVGCAVIAGFPDRVVRCKGDGKGQLASGRGVVADDPAFADVGLLVALRVDDGRGGKSRSVLRLGLVVERDWLEEVYPDGLRVVHTAELTSGGQAVAITRTMFFDLVLEEQRGGRADAAAIETMLADAVRSDPFRHLGDQRTLRRFLARLEWLRRAMPSAELPAIGTEEVGEAAAQLAPGKRNLRDFRDAPVLDLLRSTLTRTQQELVRREAPDKVTLASGRELRVDYDPEPHIAARLQEFFGTPETPRLAGGAVPLQLQLLAPNGRPVQITSDLASFWQTIYPRVQSELRNRYPKHAWPDDPLRAKPDRPGRRRKPR